MFSDHNYEHVCGFRDLTSYYREGRLVNVSPSEPTFDSVFKSGDTIHWHVSPIYNLLVSQDASDELIQLNILREHLNDNIS